MLSHHLVPPNYFKEPQISELLQSTCKCLAGPKPDPTSFVMKVTSVVPYGSEADIPYMGPKGIASDSRESCTK